MLNPQNNQSKSKVFLHLFLSIVFVLGGLIFGVPGWKLYLRGSDARGRVADVSSKLSRGGITKAPIIEFSTQKNEKITFKSKVYTNWNTYETGEAINVKYNRDNPEEAVVNNKFDIFVLPSIFIIAGLIILIKLGISRT